WRPYWRGHWSWRDDWVWVSADPWGDVPFHYGDWAWSGRFGWVWIPGAVWSPARVTWIVDGPVIAWAPAGLQITIGSAPRFWVYADREHFTRGIVRPHRLPPPRGHFHGRTVIRDVDRVFVPNRPVGRVLREEPRRERTVTVGGERRLVSPRDDRPNRGFRFESTRGSGRGMGAARGFERRDAR
ncbi:MAG TPA: DUF6600 domain-containing protein, partial [Nitrospiria bacterium]|nr:DUF6600 domain-containing protein [Nitrospiria bacterium]